MNVDNLQKINALASELRKYNFADSSEDAFRQAEQTLNQGERSQTQAAVVSESQPVQKPVQEPVQQPQDGLVQRQVEILLEQHGRKQQQEVALLRAAVNQLSAELSALKGQLEKLSVQAPPKPKEKQVELPKEAKEDHPRQGKFTSNDVDIQKMFYFGNK